MKLTFSDSEPDDSLPLDDHDKDQDDDEDFDWQIEQTPYEESKVSLEAPKYGFANRRSGIWHRLQVLILVPYLFKLLSNKTPSPKIVIFFYEEVG